MTSNYSPNAQEVIFNDITERVVQWMADKYPDFAMKIQDSINEAQREQKALRGTVEKYKELICNEKKEVVESLKKRLEKFVEDIIHEKNPFFSKVEKAHLQLLDLQKEYESNCKKIEKLLKEIKDQKESMELQLKPLRTSSSIFEDIYKMKDDFKILKTGFDSFKNGLKKMFEEKTPVSLQKPLSDFEMSIRTKNCLNNMDINTVEQLLSITDEELRRSRNFGEKSLKEVQKIREIILKDSA